MEPDLEAYFQLCSLLGALCNTNGGKINWLFVQENIEIMIIFSIGKIMLNLSYYQIDPKFLFKGHLRYKTIFCHKVAVNV